MKREKKAKPSDYPIFAFRISEEEKGRLNDEIERVVDHLNKSLSEDDRIWRKNEVIVEALKRGLAILKKERHR
jgi:hypothetical protein